MNIKFSFNSTSDSIEETDFNACCIVYDESKNYKWVYNLLPRTIPYELIKLETKPPSMPLTDVELIDWQLEYVQSRVSIKNKIDTLIAKVEDNNNQKDLTIAILDLCKYGCKNYGFKETLLTYYFSTPPYDYVETCNKLFVVYGTDILQEISPLYNQWVLPVLAEKYDFLLINDL